MSSVVFNSFKQRFLNGEVPKEDTWTFLPVNKNFNEKFVQAQDEYKLEQFRSLDDLFDHNAHEMDESYFEGIRTDYDWYKPVDTSGTNKPMFITSGVYDIDGNQLSASNWEDFKKTDFYKDVSGNKDIESYLASGGFYYILKKDELRWFADRSNSGNNRIIGVLGDGIDGVIRGQVGKSEEYPFQGILDGNGHALEDATVVCDNDDNGVVGVLGIEGTVKNFKIINNEEFLQSDENVSLLCTKQINLNHIKKDGRDINAGMLVGRNYGKVENIDAFNLGTFKFSGFVPQVYSVTNKSDEYEDFSTIRSKYDEGENMYYLNSWCINSPGNCCPYVGYFAEGLFAQSARGRDTSGNVTAIEAYPALKSKYNAGVCDVELNLSNTCSDVALFVKAASAKGIYTGSNTACLNDPLYNQYADTEWGTNCVFFIGYTTKDEKGQDVKYMLELNGTAYDKKIGTGKRRYYFHAGHYNFKKKLHQYTLGSDFDAWADTNYKDLDADDGKITCKSYYPLGWGDDDSDDKKGKWPYAIKTLVVFNNGGDETSDDGIEDSDFEISDSDIKVYTLDGVPAKIVSTEIETLRFQPRNKDTSSSVWNAIYWYLRIKRGEYHYSGMVKDHTGKDYTWIFYFKQQDADDIWVGKSNDDKNGHMLNLCSANRMKNYKFENGVPSEVGGTGTDSVKNRGRYFFFEGKYTDEAIHEKVQANLAKVGTDEFVEGDLGIEIPETLRTAVINSCAQQICQDAASSETSSKSMFHWKYGADTEGPNHYASRILVDEDDKGTFEDYFKNRTTVWNNGTTYDGLHKYDILINSDNGIKAKGTISLTLLKLNDFQYRPFVHASKSDELDADPFDEENGGWSAASGNIYPGAKFGNVSAKYGSNSATSANATARAIDYFTDKAHAFIRNPNYYGMDVDGMWTTNVVRPDPEDRPWRGLTGKTSETWFSTLNFNWNIMRHMFDTDNKWFTYMKNYENYDDPEPGNLDTHVEKNISGMIVRIYPGMDMKDKNATHSDIPHALLNKPLKMNTMARAAYYISPIVGANYGRIQHVGVSSNRTNVGNFVGFIGSIAGKQERGLVDFCSVYAKDTFKYFEEYPSKPDYDHMDETAFSAAMAKYDEACKNYNYQVRYKQTPIMPPSVSEAVTTLTKNPDDDWETYQWYPQGSESRFDMEEFEGLSGGWSAKKEYLKEYGVTMYISAATGEAKNYFSVYTANPDYIFEKGFYNASAPIRAFTSAWYDDYSVTATEVMDDVVTYNLRPIFNAGGLFGKVIPTYNSANLDITGNTPVTGTKFQNCNVHYILNDSVPESAVKSEALVKQHSKDIHDTFGAIAGMIEIQTSNIGQSALRDNVNAVVLNEVNVSGEGNCKEKILPFGFMAYTPNELNSMAATEGSPRQKAGEWGGEYTDTTFAIDLPIVIDNDVDFSYRRNNYAPINQSSAAFFNFNYKKYESQIEARHLAGDKTLPYFRDILSAVIKTNGNVNINTENLTYCNPSSLDIYFDWRGPQTLDGLFGSYTTFSPSLALTGSADAGRAAIEELETFNRTRRYEVGHHGLAAPTAGDSIFNAITNFSPINVDCLSNTRIFQKQPIPDIYFDYTYSSKSAFVDDWSFKQNVKFTSALDVDKFNKGIKSNDTNIKLGYVFRDELNYSGNGFWYNNNFLHIGNSVSPKHIRTQLAYNSHLYTSGAAGYYYNDEGELVSADNKHSFGGLLVLDSQDRTVMFIDNTQGIKIEDGNSINLECSPVVYDGTSGGMLLEVK